MKKIKITRKLMGILKAYTKLYGRIERRYDKETDRLEKMMKKETGIEDIGFVFCDGEVSGIGTPDYPEKMELIHRSELEK